VKQTFKYDTWPLHQAKGRLQKLRERNANELGWQFQGTCASRKPRPPGKERHDRCQGPEENHRHRAGKRSADSDKTWLAEFKVAREKCDSLSGKLERTSARRKAESPVSSVKGSRIAGGGHLPNGVTPPVPN